MTVIPATFRRAVLPCSRFPSIHHVMLFSLWLSSTLIINISMLEHKEPAITPLSMILFAYSEPVPLAMRRTKLKTIRAVMNEKNGRNRKLMAVNPNAIASAAPRLAPPLIPRMNGSARGFRSIAWYAAPETAKLPPTTNPDSRRQKRNHTMFDISGLAQIYSCGLMKTVPKQRHIPKMTGNSISVTMNIVNVFVFPIKFVFVGSYYFRPHRPCGGGE